MLTDEKWLHPRNALRMWQNIPPPQRQLFKYWPRRI
jgi:hypothetical protein